MPTAPADSLRALQVIAGALLIGSVALLAVGAALGPLVTGEFDPMVARTVATVAVGWALISPLMAALLTRGGEEPAGAPPSPDQMRRRFLLRFALLESGVTISAVALLLGPVRWPLIAALVPLLAMVAAFPREH